MTTNEEFVVKNPYTNLERDMFIIGLSVFVAIGIVRFGVVQDIVSAVDELKIIGSLIAGFFFTSAFTIAPAAIALTEISKTTSPLLVAFWGALGSLVVDLVIFLLVIVKSGFFQFCQYQTSLGFKNTLILEIF